MSSTKRLVITGPDMDRLLKNATTKELDHYKREVERLASHIGSLRAKVSSHTTEAQALRKRVKSLTNERDSYLLQLRQTKEARAKLRAENADLRYKLREIERNAA